MIVLILIVILIVLFFKSKENFSENKKSNVAIISLFYKPKNVETWLQLHRNLGISRFYIRLEDTPELIQYLQSQPDIHLIVASSENDEDQYKSLQTRQIDTINKVINICKKDNMDWLIHIDCDEILEGNLDEIISLPNFVGTFWMQNHEAVYQGIPTSKDNCFQAKFYKDCGKENCASYVNGKGGGRISSSLESQGPHRFKSNGEEVKINMIVKHYESCDFEQYIKKYSRLKKGVKLDSIPFPYYRESIVAKDNIELLTEIYKKYRTSSS